MRRISSQRSHEAVDPPHQEKDLQQKWNTLVWEQMWTELYRHYRTTPFWRMCLGSASLQTQHWTWAHSPQTGTISMDKPIHQNETTIFLPNIYKYCQYPFCHFGCLLFFSGSNQVLAVERLSRHGWLKPLKVKCTGKPVCWQTCEIPA